jgi:hypothetical protein
VTGLGHNRAHLDWLDGILDRYPHLVLENCSSGGMRWDYALLSRLQLQSTSDQQNLHLYAPIAASAPTAVTPEQAPSGPTRSRRTPSTRSPSPWRADNSAASQDEVPVLAAALKRVRSVRQSGGLATTRARGGGFDGCGRRAGGERGVPAPALAQCWASHAQDDQHRDHGGA